MHDQLVIPPCDVLIHAGDITGKGAIRALARFNLWVQDLLDAGTVKDAVYIAGNHDLTLDRARAMAVPLLTAGHYLDNSLVYVGPTPAELLCVYGVPEQPEFQDWGFNVTEERLVELYDQVPPDVDILVTHGPPKGVLDKNRQGVRCGSSALLDWIDKHQPRLVVCGHIHEGYGTALVGRTLVVNASTCTVAYKPTNQPIILDVH
jgi:Icc-related predicted phosphoesterase